MSEQDIELPCPICGVEGMLKMSTHIDEIPYFGEHTQITILCDACGWRQTDFIPAEGKKPSGWSLVISKSHASPRLSLLHAFPPNTTSTLGSSCASVAVCTPP